MSTTFPVTTPICIIILENLFCPSSELVNAAPTAPIANIKAPIPVAIIAPLKVLKLFTTPPSVPTNPLNFVIAPPAAESN